MKMQIVLPLLLLTAFANDARAGEVYRCNQDGKVTYSDQPCGKDAAKIDLQVPPPAAKKADTEAKGPLPAAPGARPVAGCMPTEGMAPREAAVKGEARRVIMPRVKDATATFGKVLYTRLDCTDGRYHVVCAWINTKSSRDPNPGGDIYVYRVDEDGRGEFASSAAVKAADKSAPDAPRRGLEEAARMNAYLDACTTYGR